MNQIEYSIFCDHAGVDENNKLVLAGVFDKLLTKKLPALHKLMFVVTKYVLPHGSYRITLVLNQEDQVLAKTTFDKEIDSNLNSGSHIWQIENLKIESWENLELQIYINGAQIYIKTLPVLQI